MNENVIEVIETEEKTEKQKQKENRKAIAKQYVKASVHYGHAPKEWNPKMAPYILCSKYGYHIFDLVKTAKLLKIAGNVLEKKAEKGEKFLFVGTNKLSSSIIAKQAQRINSFYINYRWLGGMLTNWSTIKKRIDRLKSMEEQEKNGTFEKLSKKEYSSKRKEMEKLKRLFKGIKEMKDLPDMVIFTNQFKDSLAIQECLRLGIPAICIVDTNCDPDLVPFPIPANDDSSSSITFILNYLVNRIMLGYNRSQLLN
jgi:small subunit ribosomal protein S2